MTEPVSSSDDSRPKGWNMGQSVVNALPGAVLSLCVALGTSWAAISTKVEVLQTDLASREKLFDAKLGAVAEAQGARLTKIETAITGDQRERNSFQTDVLTRLGMISADIAALKARNDERRVR